MSAEPLSRDIAPLMARPWMGHAPSWLVIGAASNGLKRYPPKPEWVDALHWEADLQGVAVWDKSNLKAGERRKAYPKYEG